MRCGGQLGAIGFVELAADQARRAIVAEVRAAGTTWQEIGDALDVTRQAAIYPRPEARHSPINSARP